MPFALDWVRDVRVNRSAVDRRTDTLHARRTVQGEWRSAWLLRAVTLIDLTTLAGDDTPGYIRRLCSRAARPMRAELLESLGVAGLHLRVGAVCVYHAFVATAVEALRGTGIPVAAVSAGFPAGLSPLGLRIAEIRASVQAGADEIDVVITRSHVLNGAWEALYDEVRSFREACGDARVKVILGTGELGTLGNVARASLVAMMAGADFIKTSTGKEPVNAVLPVGLVMARMIRDFEARTGYVVGLKPAGGIVTAAQALEWMALVFEELGPDRLAPRLFRFGASSLLGDIERRLEDHVTGRYPAGFRLPAV